MYNSIMKLTEEEKQLILKKREEEDMDAPKLTGVAKHDLYYADISGYDIRLDVGDIIDEYGCVFSEEIKDKIIKKAMECLERDIKKVLNKGTSFTCYYGDDGEQLWHDNHGGWVEEASEEFAKQNLTNIKPYNSKKKTK